MTHERGQRPTGLPSEVATWRELSRARPRPEFDPDRKTATVRIQLSRDGTVLALDSLAGDSVALAVAREVVARLRFDPALRNAEPVDGELIQSFGFPVGYVPSG
jgi:hypothetical protein